MTKGFNVSFLSDDFIEKHSLKFLKKHHPSFEIPIPIDDIVEKRLKIDIIPIPNLQRVHQIEGFISSDLREISVDQFIMEKIPNRYRFTLAHEIGHFCLHKDIFQSAKLRLTSEWKEFVNLLPEKDHSRFEYQAYAFAGFVLVPTEKLQQEITTFKSVLIKEGISLDSMLDIAWEIIHEELAEKFHVSKDVIIRRIQKEGLY